MPPLSRRSVILLVTILLVRAGEARGGVADAARWDAGGETLVTWEIAGSVTSVSDATGFLGDAVGIGSPFSISYTFDAATVDSNPDPARGTYNDAITSIAGTIGSLAFSGPLPGENFIFVSIGESVFQGDRYGARLVVDLANRSANVRLNFSGILTDAFDADSLPLSPEDLSVFNSRRVQLFSEADPSFGIASDITTIVPEPRCLWLLTLASACCVMRRW